MFSQYSQPSVSSDSWFQESLWKSTVASAPPVSSGVFVRTHAQPPVYFTSYLDDELQYIMQCNYCVNDCLDGTGRSDKKAKSE